MSLINDVLKDLERRNAQESTAGTPRPGERRRPSSTSRAWKWPLWLIAALALGVILHLSLTPRSPSNSSSETGPLIAQADSHAKPEPTAATNHGVANEHTVTSASTDPNAPTSATVEPAQSPAPSASEPLVQSSESRPLNQAPQIAAAPGDTQMEKPSQTNSPEPDSRAQSKRGPDPDPAPATNPSRPQPEPARQESQADQPNISIRRSGESPDRSDPLAAAKRFLARGQFQRAESRLRQVVDEQPALTQAHELLANTLIQRRRPDTAIDVLESGLSKAREPAVLAALLGRLLMERGEVMRARGVLQAHEPGLAESPDYHLLLAAAHRQAGDHEAAAALYRKLTGILPRRGAAWIGLGASLESLQSPEEAVEAYTRALEGDDARAARFARRRLTALEPITGEPQ